MRSPKEWERLAEESRRRAERQRRESGTWVPRPWIAAVLLVLSLFFVTALGYYAVEALVKALSI